MSNYACHPVTLGSSCWEGGSPGKVPPPWVTAPGHQEDAELWAERGDGMLGTQVTHLNVSWGSCSQFWGQRDVCSNQSLRGAWWLGAQTPQGWGSGSSHKASHMSAEVLRVRGIQTAWLGWALLVVSRPAAVTEAEVHPSRFPSRSRKIHQNPELASRSKWYKVWGVVDTVGPCPDLPSGLSLRTEVIPQVLAVLTANSLQLNSLSQRLTALDWGQPPCSRSYPLPRDSSCPATVSQWQVLKAQLPRHNLGHLQGHPCPRAPHEISWGLC